MTKSVDETESEKGFDKRFRGYFYPLFFFKNSSFTKLVRNPFPPILPGKKRFNALCVTDRPYKPIFLL